MNTFKTACFYTGVTVLSLAIFAAPFVITALMFNAVKFI